MLKKRIKFRDFDGEEKSEDFYFNLTKAEIIELQASCRGGLDVELQRIMDEKDNNALVQLTKNIISKSYGEKRDGKFVKTPDISAAFMSSEAYSELFLSLLHDPEESSKFISDILSLTDEERKTVDKYVEEHKPQVGIE